VKTSNGIYITTNADLQNYRTRIPAIARNFFPAVEIVITPENLPFEIGFDSSACPRPYDQYGKIDERTAKDIGKELKRNGMVIAQVHSPSDFEMEGFNEALFKSLFYFCSVLRNESDLRQLSFNYHAIGVSPDSAGGGSYGEKRRNAHRQLEDLARSIYQVNGGCGSPCDLLLAENNGIGENHEPPARCNRSKLKITDLLPEDFLGREGIHGNTFDFSHGWRVTECFAQGIRYPNLDWCEEQYGKLPPSATDFSAFISRIAPLTRWVHVAGESDAVSHQRLHLDDKENAIDYGRYVGVFKEHMDTESDIGVTIETIDSPTNAGFERMTGYLKRLNELFNGSGG
jgi:hypothetical protein